MTSLENFVWLIFQGTTRKIFFCVWEHSSDGAFSIKSATWIQGGNNQEIIRSKLIKNMWKLWIPPKVKIFAWLFILDRLHIQNLNTSCPICNGNEESQNHLFLNCYYAIQVWNFSQVSPWINNNFQVNHVLLDWLENLSCNEEVELSDLSKAILTCWQIWQDRNTKVFNSIDPNALKSAVIASKVGNLLS